MKRPAGDGLPRVIKIGPLRYTVKVATNLRIKAKDAAYTEGFHHEDDVIALRGVHSDDDLHIEIDRDLPPTLFRQTVIHELLHALVAQSTVTDMFENSETEEKFVRRVAPWLLGLIDENPRLVEFITGRRQGGAGSAAWWRRNG